METLFRDFHPLSPNPRRANDIIKHRIQICRTQKNPLKAMGKHAQTRQISQTTLQSKKHTQSPARPSCQPAQKALKMCMPPWWMSCWDRFGILSHLLAFPCFFGFLEVFLFCWLMTGHQEFHVDLIARPRQSTWRASTTWDLESSMLLQRRVDSSRLKPFRSWRWLSHSFKRQNRLN